MWFFGREKLKISPRPYVEVRMEAIGGQGANSAGKILAEIAVLEEHYTGNHFSSFGSEKRGTPVKSFVRYSSSHKPIRSAAAIRVPNLLVIFHEYMISSHPEIFDGVGLETDVLINTHLEPHQLYLPKGIHPRWLGTVDATRISRKSGAGLNAVMLGAMVPFLPELKLSNFLKTLERFFVKISSERRQQNVSGFDQGFHDVKIKTPLSGQDRIVPKETRLPRMGYENAPIGGVIVNPGNSILKSHEASRKGLAPRLNTEECCHCGYCDMVCPDYCFVWKPNPSFQKGAQLLGIDYQFCKGCQKCIEVCPVNALTQVPEIEIPGIEKQFSILSQLKKGSL